MLATTTLFQITPCFGLILKSQYYFANLVHAIIMGILSSANCYSFPHALSTLSMGECIVNLQNADFALN
jgi:hypothetical protein